MYPKQNRNNMGYLDDRFTKQPEERDAVPNTGAEVTTPATETSTTEQTSEVQNTQQTDTGQSQAKETVVPDTFLEQMNKEFSTSFKDRDELKNIFGMPSKISELEGKAKLADDYSKKVEDYEKQLGELKNNGNSELLSKPLLRKAYIADQLLTKYPDKDAYVLQEIVMADVDKMSDLDVLVKDQKIDLPNLSERDIKEALLDKYGIDPETKPEEWSSIARTKLAMDAKSARANIKSLTNGIEFPKTGTKEEREAIENASLQKRVELSTPLKAEFTQFDKFKIGDFEFDPSSEFKSKLGDTFDAMFIKGGLEPTKENLAMAKELRDSQFLYQHFDKIKEVLIKGAQTEMQKKLDEKLNNTQTPNTATASDDGDKGQVLPGLAQFLAKNR